MTETNTNRQQLTIKRGVLAVIVMYARQLLVGVAISYAIKIIFPANKIPVETLD